MSVIRRLHKQCRCRGTASGPRVVLSGGQPYGTPIGENRCMWGDTLSVEARYVELACDECDAEWLPASGPGEKGEPT